MQPRQLEKLGLLASLYISQGIPHGFRLASPVIFRERGLSAQEIGVYTLLVYLPWVFKLVLAPLVDLIYVRRFGRRRSWILPAQSIMAALVLSLAFLGQDIELSRLLLLLFLINLFSAIQDIGTDGYGVDILEPHERGWGNGVQMGGYWLGFMLGGGLIMVLISRWGWTASFVCMTLLIAVAGVPAWLTSERPIARAEVVRHGLFSFLFRRSTWAVLIFLMAYRGAEGFVRRWATTLLWDMGYTYADIGMMQGLVGPIAGLGGAFLGGYLMPFISRRRALFLFGGAQVIYFAAWTKVALMGVSSSSELMGIVIVDHVIASMSIVAVFSFMMDLSNREHGATDYTIQDCAGILSALVLTMVSGAFAEVRGYAFSFAAGMAVVVLSMVILRFLPARLFSVGQGADLDD